MSTLSNDFLSKHTNSVNAEDVRVLHLYSQEILYINPTTSDSVRSEPVLLPNVCLLNCGNNSIGDCNLSPLSHFWSKFPSAWWVDLSNNKIRTLNEGDFPNVIGSLNVVGNEQIRSLQQLPPVNRLILRLKCLNASIEVEKVGEFGSSADIWVFNDDFLRRSPKQVDHQSKQHPVLTRRQSTYSRVYDSDKIGNGTAASVWNHTYPSDRALNMFAAVQDLPLHAELADDFKLDILLEDYFEEARIWNQFHHSVCIINNTATRLFTQSKAILDPAVFIHVPHRQRVDLSVLLTASIMFDLPSVVLEDTMVLLLGQYLETTCIKSLIELPLFAKTALVSLIKRLCRTELEEIRVNKGLSKKPSLAALPRFDFNKYAGAHPPPPTFRGSNGFYHLRAIKYYLQIPTLSKTKDILSNDESLLPFSELEIEILQLLPDCPTRAVSRRAGDTSWTELCARHAVLLLSRAPSCPPLNRAQTNMVHQGLYTQLLPILSHAKLNMESLEIELTGADRDGRVISSKTLLKALGKNASLYAGSKLLPFGMGLPNGGPNSLSWKIPEHHKARAYSRPWLGTGNPSDAHKKEGLTYLTCPIPLTDDIESTDGCNALIGNDSVFLTSEYNAQYEAKSSTASNRNVLSTFESLDYHTIEKEELAMVIPNAYDSNVKSIAVTSKIKGYSVDNLWESDFILASAKTLSLSSPAHGQEGSRRSSPTHQHKTWQELEEAPVIVVRPVSASSDIDRPLSRQKASPPHSPKGIVQGFSTGLSLDTTTNVRDRCTDSMIDQKISRAAEDLVLNMGTVMNVRFYNAKPLPNARADDSMAQVMNAVKPLKVPRTKKDSYTSAVGAAAAAAFGKTKLPEKPGRVVNKANLLSENLYFQGLLNGRIPIDKTVSVRMKKDMFSSRPSQLPTMHDVSQLTAMSSKDGYSVPRVDTAIDIENALRSRLTVDTNHHVPPSYRGQRVSTPKSLRPSFDLSLNGDCHVHPENTSNTNSHKSPYGAFTVSIKPMPPKEEEEEDDDNSYSSVAGNMTLTSSKTVYKQYSSVINAAQTTTAPSSDVSPSQTQHVPQREFAAGRVWTVHLDEDDNAQDTKFLPKRIDAWPGSTRHKAATHKLTLNRAFGCSVTVPKNTVQFQ